LAEFECESLIKVVTLIISCWYHVGTAKHCNAQELYNHFFQIERVKSS